MQPSGQSFEERQGLKALPYDNSHPTPAPYDNFEERQGLKALPYGNSHPTPRPTTTRTQHRRAAVFYVGQGLQALPVSALLDARKVPALTARTRLEHLEGGGQVGARAGLRQQPLVVPSRTRIDVRRAAQPYAQ